MTQSVLRVNNALRHHEKTSSSSSASSRDFAWDFDSVQDSGGALRDMGESQETKQVVKHGMDTSMYAIHHHGTLWQTDLLEK